MRTFLFFFVFNVTLWLVRNGQFLTMRRFPAEQLGKDATSYECRPIDDCTASGLNVSISFKERLKMDGLKASLAAAHAVYRTFQS